MKQALLNSAEHYPFLEPFRLQQRQFTEADYFPRLQQQLAELPIDPEGSSLLVHLVQREKGCGIVIQDFFQLENERIVQLNLQTENSFEILARNTLLMDSIIQAAFDFALNDLPLLRRLHVEQMETELHYKQRILPEKQEKLGRVEQELENIPSQGGEREEREMRRYYQKICGDLQNDIEEHAERVGQLEELLETARDCPVDHEFVEAHLVILARGGYGRGELSLASDRDLGYCLDTEQLAPGQAEVVRQLVIRIETLLNAAQVTTAHQYFEIDEDLTRFQQGSMLQTIPSILESRVLVGSQRLAERLKQHFFEILPYEPYVLEKINTYLQTERPQLNQADLKYDLGGLRSLQIPLWIAAATFGVFPSYTAEMIALLIKQRLLSPRQAFKLCQALEFTYDLRNFTGAARDHYFDEEARHSGCRGEDLLPNVINDNMERLYLLKKPRFQDVDDFDRYRLQMQDTIQQLSRALLRNILERHVVRTFQTFQVTVYLRQRRIIEINALEGMPQVPLSLIFSDPLKLLDLFIYIGKVGYDLSFELKDEMADLLQSLTVEVVQSRTPELSEKFSELMMTPYVDQALRIMLEIADPIGLNDPAFFGGTTAQRYLPDTLLGRFIPECNQMHFLLRNLSYHQYPVSIHSLNAVQAAEEELQILQKQYPELYQYLQPKHVLALKWAVLFHDVGKIDPRTRHQISGTSIAVRALERLGYTDPELFGSVSLMIAHHMTVVQLSKTSAYFDQAIQQFFEIANRDLVNVILLFLVNISDYRSVSDVTAKDTRTLRTFFEETYRVYAEMRSSGQLNDAMDAINSYLDRKKQDLEFDTRINLLIQQGLQNSIEDALYAPVAQIQPQEYERLQKGHEELEQHWRLLKMGSLDEKGLSQTTEKLIRTIRQYLSPETINALINPYRRQLEWFFAAFPNRFLLSSSSAILAQQMMRFENWAAEATVSVLTNPRGRPVGLLVFVREPPQIHSRIAYALSRRQINIEGAKMNRIAFADGRSAYCYYLQITVRSSAMIFPRELEHSILYDSPPRLDLDQQHFLHNPRLQLEFLEDDEKGYVVQEVDGHFVRMARSYLRVKLTLEDAPLIFYKIANSFDRFEVPVQQSLITTTGFQVNDYFYILPQDLERLRSSGFEEVVKRSLSDPPSHN